MSFADDLNKADKQLKTAEKQEKVKKKRKTGTRRGSTWSKEDEFIAFFLFKSGASKFLKENYAAKRNVSVSAMDRKIKAFESLAAGKKSDDATETCHEIAKSYGDKDMDTIKQVTISILRGDGGLT